MRRWRFTAVYREPVTLFTGDKYCAKHGQKYDPSKFSMCFHCYREKCCDIAGCNKFGKYLITAPNNHWHQKLCEEHSKGRTHMGLERITA